MGLAVPEQAAPMAKVPIPDQSGAPSSARRKHYRIGARTASEVIGPFFTAWSAHRTPRLDDGQLTLPLPSPAGHPCCPVRRAQVAAGRLCFTI